MDTGDTRPFGHGAAADLAAPIQKATAQRPGPPPVPLRPTPGCCRPSTGSTTSTQTPSARRNSAPQKYGSAVVPHTAGSRALPRTGEPVDLLPTHAPLP